MSSSIAKGPDSSTEPIGPGRDRGPLVLVVDLDTFVRGSDQAAARLTERLAQRPHTSVVYAAPDRSIDSALACIDVLHLAAPDVVVADGGASVRATRHHAGLDALDARIGERWPGTPEVRKRVDAVGHLLDQLGSDATRRVSVFPRDDHSVEEVQVAVEHALDDLEVDVRISDEEQIDVLPPDTDIASTVKHTLETLHVDPSWVVVAGGFVEPRFFNEGTYWGIATGDTPEPVRASLAPEPRVHVTKVEGPRGVIDGLQALGFI